MAENINDSIIDITEEMVWSYMPHRIEESHKGTYGKLLCVAGNNRFRGAAALAVEGALRTGCGIIALASVENVFHSIQSRLPECILHPCKMSDNGSISEEMAESLSAELQNDYTALMMGPGMGNNPDTVRLVRHLVSSAPCGVVLDADALNALSPLFSHPIERSQDPAYNAYTRSAADKKLYGEESTFKIPDWPRPIGSFPMIVTPHPGEMARLCNLTVAEVKANIEQVAVRFAMDNKCVTILKDHRTIIASPMGRIWRNVSGNSGLARGGSGDILAGMIGSFLALGMDATEAAICAVWLHGAAADRCADKLSKTGMLPHDIFPYLQEMLRENGR